MMKYIAAFLLAFCFAVNANAAKKATVSPENVPFPPERVFAQAQVINPDPFNVNRTPQIMPTPVPQPTPVVVQAPPAETKATDWGSLGLSGIIAALLSKLAFWPKAGTKTPAVLGGLPEIDPHLKTTIENAALSLIKSGQPGEAIKIGLSLIPGAGPIVNMLEPAFRAISIKFIEDRIGVVPTQTVDPVAAPAVTNVLNILADLIAKHKAAS